MLVDIINKNESTLMIEYNNDVFKFVIFSNDTTNY